MKVVLNTHEGPVTLHNRNMGSKQDVPLGPLPLELYCKYMIEGGPKSRITLDIDGTMIKMGNGVRFEFETTDKWVKEWAASSPENRKTSFGTKLGQVWGKISEALGSDNKFEQRTDNAVAGVRG